MAEHRVAVAWDLHELGGTAEARAEGVGEEPEVPGTANDRVVTVELAGFNQP